MPKIFISYRRDDSAYVAQTIYDKLAGHYGKESVIFDVDTIPKGIDFVQYLQEQVSVCDVLLAVIGERWLDVQADDGSRRIDNPKDFVRIEIQAALKRGIPVIPVLVEKASMPAAAVLPRSLKPLSRCNAAEVRAGRDFQTHLDRLVRDVAVSLQHVSRTPERPTASQKPAAKQPQAKDRPSPKRQPPPVASRPTVSPDAADEDIITNTIGMQLRLLPAGTFLMGTAGSAAGDSTESPQHQVCLTESFRLGVYPVTQAEYERVVGENPSQFTGDDRHPVERVSWLEAIKFCNRLSQQEELPPYYDAAQKDRVKILRGVGYRLPTEAEWEYACRAGSEGSYCFGDDPEELGRYAWFSENSERRTYPVGEKQANAWGLCGMHGNVWEWCWDRYDGDYYRESPKENPTGPSEGSVRVSRGGSWNGGARGCRSACRRRSVPEYRYDCLGFRLARSSVRQDQVSGAGSEG